jgi:hypothetical protein
LRGGGGARPDSEGIDKLLKPYAQETSFHEEQLSKRGLSGPLPLT